METVDVVRRRRFLVYAVALGGAGLGLGVLLVHPRRRRERVLLEVESLLGSDDRWVAIGRDYLSRTPAENDLATLGELLVDPIGWAVLWRSAADTPSLIAELVRNDFRDGHVVSLRGWVLSRSAARLCALKALLSARTVNGRS